MHEIITNLVALRKRLIYALLGFILCFGVLANFSNDIYHLFAKPLLIYLPQNTELIATDILSPFWVPLKLTLLIAFFLAIPNTVLQLWLFISPALYLAEKKLLLIITLLAVLLFMLGILFCYYLVLPALFKFINHIKAADIVLMTDIVKYFDFVLKLFFIFAICFETPIIIFLLIYFNLISYNKLKSLRPYIFVMSFIVAAILTPPDVLSQVMLAIPLYILYEIGLLGGLLIHE